MTAPLTRSQAAMLRFAARHAGTQGTALEIAVYEAFGLGLVGYFQQLHRLVQLPAAEAADPITVRRYRRIAAARTRRVEGRSSTTPAVPLEAHP